MFLVVWAKWLTKNCVCPGSDLQQHWEWEPWVVKLLQFLRDKMCVLQNDPAFVIAAKTFGPLQRTLVKACLPPDPAVEEFTDFMIWRTRSWWSRWRGRAKLMGPEGWCGWMRWLARQFTALTGTCSKNNTYNMGMPRVSAGPIFKTVVSFQPAWSGN